MGLETLLLMGGTAAITGGMATQMRGAQEQADAAVATARYEAGVYKAREVETRRLSAEEQKLMREDLRSTLKRQKALIAKGGTTMRGSPMLIQLRTVEDMARDIGRLSHARAVEARRLGSQASLSMVEAKFARKAGKIQKRQALWGGVSSLATLGLQYKLATRVGKTTDLTSGLTTEGKATLSRY